MEFDVYNVGAALGEVSDLAREVEDLGFSGMWFTESKSRSTWPGSTA